MLPPKYVPPRRSYEAGDRDVGTPSRVLVSPHKIDDFDGQVVFVRDFHVFLYYIDNTRRGVILQQILL